jgi:SAM-dependent methyltransferase
VTGSDAVFAGSMPALYDRYLGPLYFEPYAADLAARVRTQPPSRVLEVAAGTGIVTRALHDALPDATITATDLNPGMVAHGSGRVSAPNVVWSVADAMALPFGDAEFDLVVCQFGAMFFPDRIRAFREAHRVLAPGGRLLLSMWDSVEHNELPGTIARAVAAAFPDEPPSFVTRTPHGHFDTARTEAELRDAGFDPVEIAVVDARSRAPSATDPAIGMCQGSPLRAEIEKRDPSRLAEVTQAAADAVAARFGDGPIDVPMRAFVFDARR